MRLRSVVSLRITIVVVLACAQACSGGTGDDTGLPQSSGTPAPPVSGPHGTGGHDAGATPGQPDASPAPDGGALAHDAGAAADTGSGSADAGTPTDGLSSLQKQKAEMLTSIWENSTTILQYPYCQNIGDGRGYTSGRAGFCSGTGDAIQVVACFDAAFGTSSQNPMAKYMPALTQINDKFNSTGQDQGDTSLLDAVGKYCNDWSSTTTGATTGPQFKACQDQITDALYYKPGLAQAKKWGLVTALTKAELYDAEINHGDDGVAALIKQANADVGNGAQKPPSGSLALADESKWLHAFLMRRLALLKSDATWAQSEDRVSEYEQLRLDGNFDLSARIETNAKAINMFPNQGYKDSGYPDCIISAAGAVSGDAACTSPTGQ